MRDTLTKSFVPSKGLRQRLYGVLALMPLCFGMAVAQELSRGAKLFAGDMQNVLVTGVPHNYYAYNLNNLYLSSPRDQNLGGFSSFILVYYGLSQYYFPGHTNLGEFRPSDAGAKELVFRLESREPWLDWNGNWQGGFNDPNLWFTGPGSRNSDGLPHADVAWIDGKTARVSFEDSPGGGDLSYNDATFEISGVHPGVDLRVSDLSYTVTNSGLPSAKYLPIAANGVLRVQFDVENIGSATMQFPSKVGLYCSSDSAITREDTLLKMVDVPAGIESDSKVSIVIDDIDMSDALLNRQAWGMHYIGTLCDPNLEIAEAKRDNNANWSELKRKVVLEKGMFWENGYIGQDTIGFYVYDPMAYGGFAQPNAVFPTVEFESYNEAVTAIKAAGFRSVETVEGVNSFRLRSNTSAFSYYFGRMLGGTFWTVHGHVLPKGGKYGIHTQAATGNYPFGSTLIHGEPDPYQLSASWIRYARLWHTAY